MGRRLVGGGGGGKRRRRGGGKYVEVFGAAGMNGKKIRRCKRKARVYR